MKLDEKIRKKQLKGVSVCKVKLDEGPFAGQEWTFKADFPPDARNKQLTPTFNCKGFNGYYEYRNIPPFDPAIAFVSVK